MDAPLNTTITHQVVSIISAHIADLQDYVPLTEVEIPHPQTILEQIDWLVKTTASPPEMSTAATCEEMFYMLAQLEAFLSEMNQHIDEAFIETPLGQIWLRAQQWYEFAAQSSIRAPIKEVWGRLKPAVPDCLNELDDGSYIAKWWKPVPMMDVEIIIRTESLVVHGDPYEPDDLPGGIAVHFSVIN
jgi:hypothetical protein